MLLFEVRDVRAEICRQLSRLLSECALGLAVQMETVAQPLLEVPHGVKHAIDRSENVVAHWRNSDGDFADSRQFLKQTFAV